MNITEVSGELQRLQDDLDGWIGQLRQLGADLEAQRDEALSIFDAGGAGCGVIASFERALDSCDNAAQDGATASDTIGDLNAVLASAVAGLSASPSCSPTRVQNVARPPYDPSDPSTFDPESPPSLAPAGHPAPAGRIEGPVPGLYASVAKAAANNTAVARLPGCRATYQKWTFASATGGDAVFERAVDGDTLVFESAFLNDADPWISHEGVQLTDRGTPTQLYATLGQMSAMGLDYGSVRHARIQWIINCETVCELAQAKAEGRSVDEALASCASVRYVRTCLEQSGHRITSIRFVDGRDARLGNHLSMWEQLGALRRPRSWYLREFGLDADDMVQVDFDIEIDLEPWDGGRGE